MSQSFYIIIGMSIVMEILEGLWNTHVSYKGTRVNLLGVSRPWDHNKSSFQSTLYRMHKKGFIHRKDKKWLITESGKNYFLKQKKSLIKFDSPFDKSSPKNLLLMFDIPETRSVERQWLRLHLKRFDYYMIQKSVWVGPSPLPTKFIFYIKNIKLNEYIKTFKLAKPYQINKR
jgi:DNA-binding transcriptional regulator PaaX